MPYEHDIQVAFIDWVRLAENTLPVLKLLFAVPNGGWRHPATAKKLKAEGVIPGPADIWLPAPRQGFAGLVIEFKRPGEKMRKDQLEYNERLAVEGWFVVVCTTPESAIDTVKSYLK